MSIFCSHCGAQIKADTKFCTTCGTARDIPAGFSPILEARRGEKPRKGHYSKVKRYSGDKAALESLTSALTGWLEREDFECQTLQTEDGKTLVQLAKRGNWRKLIGMSTALNVLLNHDAAAITVEIGEGRWIDKAAVGTVSIFILWPLAVTAAIGAWNQAKMPEKIFNFINQELGEQP